MKQDIYFKRFLVFCGIVVAVIVAMVFVTLLASSLPALKEFGIAFFYREEWDPVSQNFGALPFFIGTLMSTVLALLLSLPFSISIALFLGEYNKKGIFHTVLSYATDLLAGIPSVIFGFWGLIFLVPIVRDFEMKFGITPYGVGIFTSGIVLAIMIIPYTSSIAREVIRLVPQELKEGGYALGATRFEVVRDIIIPYAKSGIIAGILLSFGRALGETMAVTMVIGNSNFIPMSIFSPGNSMASVIANEFNEATQTLHLSSLILIGFYLFLISILFNYIGQLIIKRMKA